MHLGKSFAMVVFTLGLAASLTSCGFHLRGTQPTSTQQSLKYLNFKFPDQARDLEERLSISLGSVGVDTQPNSQADVIRILEYTPRRQMLNGRLTEVYLRLSVTFQLETASGQVLTEPRTLTATRNYQYERATVNTENQEESYLNGLILDDLTQKITNQIINQRLPAYRTTP